jgi:hypothetical protein
LGLGQKCLQHPWSPESAVPLQPPPPWPPWLSLGVPKVPAARWTKCASFFFYALKAQDQGQKGLQQL